MSVAGIETLNWNCKPSTKERISKNLMPKIVNASREVANQTPLERAILEAIEQARSTCDIQGNASAGCAVAWDIVEELQAEKSHRQATEKFKTSLEHYCDENPNAPECLIYDI